MAKPIVERSKKRTKVIYNKKKKHSDKKVVIASVAGIVVLATSLGLGLGLGLKKKTIIGNYKTLIKKENSYPVKIIYEKEDKIAEEVLYEIYDKDTLRKTYIDYDRNWLFKNKLEETKLIIVLPIQSWSANKQMEYLATFNEEDKPKFIHVFEFDKEVLYNIIKDNLGG